MNKNIKGGLTITIDAYDVSDACKIFPDESIHLEPILYIAAEERYGSVRR